jgi:ABC-type polysaccharide/polyol phosphate transport system ATPase subunit
MLREGEIVASNIWKRFRPDMKQRSLAAQVRNLPNVMRGHRGQWLWALKDVDFAVQPGEAVGLVGANGSGKSTLLKILNRVMYPYAGQVQVRGRTGALIEVATGLHPELSGRENITLYGSLLGLRRREVAAKFDAIVEFAELEHAIDRQLKFYSSGMRIRLGFSVAAFLEPSILLVDEVLAVGDARFQQRCLDRMATVHNQGTTVVYVSHDLQTVEATCSRAAWLHNGVVMRDGPVADVLSDYRSAVEEELELSPPTGVLTVEDAQVFGVDGRAPHTGKPLEVEVTLSSPIDSTALVDIGVTQGTATPVVLVSSSCSIGRGKTTLRCTLETLPVPSGRYFLWLSVGAPPGQRNQLLPWGPVARFEVTGPKLSPAPRGVVRLSPIFVNAEWSDH